MSITVFPSEFASREAELKSAIISMASHINAATYRLLMMIEEYDRRKLFETWECRSMAHWLTWHCAMSKSTAREHVRVARALPSLPLISAAFETGELSYSKVRAITRIAEPDSEAELLDMCRFSTASQIDRLVAGYRTVERSIEAAENQDQHQQRSCGYFWDADGNLVVTARLSPEDGIAFINAIEAAKADIPPANPEGDEDIESDRRRNNADALAELSRRALSATPNGAPAASELVVHVDARLLGPDFEEAAQDPAILSRVADGPHLPPETVQRLACDGPTRVIAELDGEPINIGRRSRSWPWPMRVAILGRDSQCFWPGCGATKGLDVHHIDWWSHGGETSIENGIAACRTHHRAIHEGGYRIEKAQAGELSVFRPDGSKVADVPDRAPLALPLEEVLPEIDPAASASKWQGDKLDLKWVTAALFHSREYRHAQAAKRQATSAA